MNTASVSSDHMTTTHKRVVHITDPGIKQHLADHNPQYLYIGGRRHADDERSPWTNPYYTYERHQGLGREMTRVDCVNYYREYMRIQIDNNPYIQAQLADTRSKTLVTYHLDEGEALAEMADECAALCEERKRLWRERPLLAIRNVQQEIMEIERAATESEQRFAAAYPESYTWHKQHTRPRFADTDIAG